MKTVLLSVALLLAGCSSNPLQISAADQCEAAKREVLALKMCFDDRYCARGPDFYREVQQSLADLEAKCSLEQQPLRNQRWLQ